ncbi:MAG: crossover junction endodeoxyribonuclease RuvC [Bacteriovoracaceae bacterium]|nr:crossover junction endodeoxyribonuclease RuvC [Bacteriovoracaceae bacterium]
MLFLGIDPGSRKAGFGLIEQKGRTFKYIDSGSLAYDKVPNFMDRLGLIYESCEALIKSYNPDEVAIESLIYVKSIPSLAKLAQARGAMIAAFMRTHQEKVFEYSPNLVKSTVSGHGHANKESVEKGLKLALGQSLNFKSHDESDALAIALCHGLMRNVPIGKSGHAKASKSGSSLRQAFRHLEKS